LVRLRIWREPDLSGDFPVNESGVVVLPKLGPRTVVTEHPDSLKAWIVRSYADYLRNPSIEVLLLRRIQVLGAVKNPGLYPVEPTMTVADAIALAGGTTPQGRSDKVELRRQGQRLPGKLSGRLLIGESPIRSGDQVFVPERSWISRNPGLVVGVVGLVTTIIIRVSR
jgi:polysaccharide export outer membrane protein